jgi:hypothetical protein
MTVKMNGCSSRTNNRNGTHGQISIGILIVQARLPEARAHWLQYDEPVVIVITPPFASGYS